jgi:hypothetical protein
MFDRLLDFEHRRQAVAAHHRFVQRFARNVAFSMAVVAVSLVVGMVCYAYFEGMDAVDSFLNAAMILSGMGPATVLQTDGGKIFAGLYALYSGLLIITITGFILAPVAHRVLHRFHVDLEDEDERRRPRKAKGPR